ncbi:MAG: lysozyme inhibitor LprI family protein, partial [Flavobacterium sp.]|nr:lysozyme inhibitor LprI family protein [Flavobacterium sp.]
EQYSGGSIQPLIYSSCLAEKTEARIADLKAFLEN